MLIGASQRAFACTRQIFFETLCVRMFHIYWLILLNVLSAIHVLPPTYRATSTRASSVGFEYRASMCSAAFCGRWFRTSCRAEALWMPSVDRTRVASTDRA